MPRGSLRYRGIRNEPHTYVKLISTLEMIVSLGSTKAKLLQGVVAARHRLGPH
jgi:hypothetical protein